MNNQVVCIKRPVPNSPKWLSKLVFPVENNTYTVRDTYIYPSGVKAYVLEEIRNEKVIIGSKLLEPAFPCMYFADVEDWYAAENLVNELMNSEIITL